MSALYEDKYIRCDETQLTIDKYRFPFGKAKVVPYDQIEELRYFQMGTFTGKGRIWGGTHRYWLNLDTKRPSKDHAIIVVIKDTFVRPIITPDDAGRVLAILEEKSGVTATAERETDVRPG